MATELDFDDVAAQSDHARTELMVLRGQREVLLAALNRMLKETDYVCGFDDPCHCPRCQARAAIASTAP